MQMVTRKSDETPESETQTPASDGPRINAAKMAALIGVDPKDFRRWLRSVHRAAGKGDALPGSGGQYGLVASDADKWAERYASRSVKGQRRNVDVSDLFVDDADADGAE